MKQQQNTDSVLYGCERDLLFRGKIMIYRVSENAMQNFSLDLWTTKYMNNSGYYDEFRHLFCPLLVLLGQFMLS